MRNILIILSILLITSCGSKKKITDIKKGYEYSNTAKKETVEQRSDIKATDTSKTKTTVSEKEKERIIEKYIFDDSGRVREYTKEAERDKQKYIDIDEVKGLTGSLSSISKITSEFDSVGEKGNYSKSIDLDKKSSPIQNWIGLGLFISVLVGLAYYLFKK